MTEPYILCGDIQIPIDKTSHLLLGHSNSTEKDSSVLKWFQRWRTRTSFAVTFKSNWKRQFKIIKIGKITKLYILCRAIQNPSEKDSSLSKWLQRWQNITLFAGTFNFQLKKTLQYWNDYKDDRTLHSFRGHSNFDWKNSSVSKWLQRPQKFTSSVGRFKFQQKKNSLVLKWFQRWQNHAFFVETLKFQLKNQFSIEMISRIKERYILCWDIQFPTEKQKLLFKWLQRWQTLTFFWRNQISIERSLHILLRHSNSNWKKTFHYPNDFKDDRTLHRLGDTKIPTGKKQFSIEMISKITELYILCGDI